MATQKILKFVIITIISTSMATNIQASLIEQGARYNTIPWDFRAFGYGMNGNWNLLELCQYDETMSVLRPIQTDIAVNDELSYITFTEGSLQEKRFEFNQIATDGRVNFDTGILYDWEAFCGYGIIPLSIQSPLGDTGFSGTELDELYKGEFVARDFCYVNDLFYGLSTFFEGSERIVITYNSEPNISSAAVPEPTTLVLLSIGTLVFIRKRR